MAVQAFARRATATLFSTAPSSRLQHAAPPLKTPAAIHHQSATLSSAGQTRVLQFQRGVRTAPRVHALASASLVEEVEKKNNENPVIVYSKSWCPYCSQVKQLFTKLEVDAKVIELDQVADGSDVQDALFEVSASRTVPQVFIGGKFVGGADDTLLEESSGELKKRLESVGITPAELKGHI